MKKGLNWQCPYCGHFQVLSEGNNLQMHDEIDTCVKTSEHEDIGFRVISVACLNKQCKKLCLTILLSEVWRYGDATLSSKPIKIWKLLPDSIAKPQPDYIPEAIKKDYEEACKIAHLSPNASAVLSRRCLQSMIRDFCKIEEKTLYDEIENLKAKLKDNQAPQGITGETMEAIDSIRKMGNIGAHMKIQTNILIDIEPEEATLLIQLIEPLFKDWYVARNERQQRLKDIQEITIKKEQQKTAEEKTKNVKAPH